MVDEYGAMSRIPWLMSMDLSSPSGQLGDSVQESENLIETIQHLDL